MASLASLAFLASAGWGAPETRPTVPTLTDLRAMYSAGQHKLCLQQIPRALALKDAQGKAQLLCLRGECLLALKDPSASRAAFTAAERMAEESSDLDERLAGARARTWGMLIASSKAGMFDLGAGKGGVAIDTDDGRKAALPVLRDAKADAAQKAVAKALDARDLPSVRAALPEVSDLQAAELTLSGKDEEARSLFAKLGEHARGLIVAEMDLLTARVDGIRSAANQADAYVGPAITGTWWATIPVRRGLHSEDREALRNAIDTCDMIQDACVRAMGFCRRAMLDSGKWEPVRSRAAQLRESAQQVLNAE